MNRKAVTNVWIVMLASFVILGCSHSPVVDFRNYSKDVIVVEVEGLVPDVSPGVLPSTRRGRGRLGGKSDHLDGPIAIAEHIVIRWRAEKVSDMYTVAIERSNLGLPRRLRRGVLSFVYEDGTWRVEHITKSYDKAVSSL